MSLEKELRDQIRHTKINKAVISTIAVAGVLAVGLVAPNVIGALGKLKLLPQRRQQVKTVFGKLLQYGYIQIEKKHGRSYVRLTTKGEHFAARMGEGRLVPKKPKHWDKKWRLLMFDIPERRRRTRTLVRQTLLNLGFYRLQDSVWVYPYDCEELIILLKADFRIGKDLLYVIADKVEHDSALRVHFNLQK
jgi:DNA-binding transcriptional regulator PaaX